jgi:hypothetical protein
MDTKRQEIMDYSSSFPAHIPQHYLAKILKKKLEGLLDSNDQIHLGNEFLAFKHNKISGVEFYFQSIIQAIYNAKHRK